ncbi:MAG: hypothetical protein EOR03_29950 [Mesorhizobium sp.]|nr:MAG: hypothetical protein EOR03_29950 [Mesorhizobium sp.]
MDDAARRNGRTHRRLQPGCDGRSRRQRIPEPRGLPRSRAGQKDRSHRRLHKAWEPSEKPFMTVVLTFEDEGEGKTRYIARVAHWSAADREEHEKMGFHQGWGQCADQLEEVARRL